MHTDNNKQVLHCAKDIVQESEEITYEKFLIKILVNGAGELNNYRPVNRAGKILFQKRSET